MTEFTACLHPVEYRSKPTGSDIGQISSEIGRHTEKLNCPASIYEFVNDVGMNGKTFSPATFVDGSRKLDNLDQMQLLVLDFDGGVPYQEVRERAEKYDLPILFSYVTFSSTDDNERFRVVYLNDIPIQDQRVAKITKSLLRTIFPESDKHDIDISRMYFGGKQLLYFDQSIPTVNLESINRNMTICLKDKRGLTNYKREIIKLAKENKIALNKNKLLDISLKEFNTEDSGVSQVDKNSPSSIMLGKPNGEILSNQFYYINLDNGYIRNSVDFKKSYCGNHNEYRSSTLDLLSKNCSLYQEFDNGERRLNHSELFGLATNIIHIETGIKRFVEILENNSYYDHENDKYCKWKKDLDYAKSNDYKPQSCSIFCPYIDTCKHGKNILLTIKPKSHIRVDGYQEEFVSIEEATQDLNRHLRAAIEADDTCVHVIKAQTSIGKTYSYIKQMASSQSRFLIAASTNILKNEISERAETEGVEVIKTPSLHEIKDEIPDDVWKHIERLYQSGQYRKVHPYIKKIAMEQKIPCLDEYMDKRYLSREFDGNVITTHKKLLYLDDEYLSNFDVVIIDEDIILKSLIPSHISVPLSKLKKLMKNSDSTALVNKIKELLKSIKSETLFTLNSFEWDEGDEGADTSTGIDVPAFCLAKHFYYRDKSKEKNLKEDHIVFMNPVMLKENVKYIIVSATADESIYKYVFGDRVKFYECRKAQYKGVLNQYIGKSFSRASIDSNPGILEWIIKKTGIKDLVTFKKYGFGPLYIGNVEGSNIYEGKDLNVAATPYEAEFLYKLFPYSLGLDFDYDAKMGSQKVTRNGYIFEMNTYKDEILQDFQLWMIESQLEQAVGRSRLLRHDCVVNLFSNFPLSQANLQEFEYEGMG